MNSSYLVTLDGYRLLLDCGNGSLRNLQRHGDVGDIDAVILSHMHPDHFGDLYGLYYALRFHKDGPRSVPVYAPPGSYDFIAQLLYGDEIFPETCKFTEAKAGDVFELGPLRVSLFASNHPVECIAQRIEGGGRILTYTGDTAPTPTLLPAARDADLLLCDATWLERQRPLPPDVHMTGQEAGRLAVDANAARLMVTHVFPQNRPEDVAAEAATVYGGEVMVADDMMEITL
jgi:ribonuclease BN (tRNA processing enzyme)